MKPAYTKSCHWSMYPDTECFDWLLCCRVSSKEVFFPLEMLRLEPGTFRLQNMHRRRSPLSGEHHHLSLLLPAAQDRAWGDRGCCCCRRCTHTKIGALDLVTCILPHFGIQSAAICLHFANLLRETPQTYSTGKENEFQLFVFQRP